ncbi:ABC transporter substrate-binding protein [Fundicoccus culcitae]|uniref:ABC transporter substrate-binding protein n=1 Tax=Fundicoccus culcitae TaxID=2969821 RepID=A0ABY5P4A2_9LACT|nr:ABC transporter substrate-binding protein [Fundicoccus culcitae]UUX33514.1 ABC transporter substrate-binding protein [Fundicoccus culcitae]
MKKFKWFTLLSTLVLGFSIFSSTLQVSAAEFSVSSLYPQPVGTIDPAKAVDYTEMAAAVNLYDPLFYPEGGGSITPMPHLASDYEVSEDGTVYTINLRNDVTFHSGNPLTANDVVYSLERMLAIGQGNSWLWEGLFEENGYVATNDHTVEFTLTRPFAPFIASLTQLFIVDSQLVQANEQDGDYGQAFLNSNDAGSGPYTLGVWNRESDFNLDWFEDYFLGWEENSVQHATILNVGEEATAKSLLISGQVDHVHGNMNPTAYVEFAQQDNLTVYDAPSATLFEAVMNTQAAPTDDINVRKAIAHAVDYTIVQQQILGNSDAARGPVPISLESNSETATVYDYDLEKAQAYMDQSAYAGQEVTVTMMYMADQTDQRQLSQLFTQNLAQIGITVELIPTTWPPFTEAMTSPETTANISVLLDSLAYPHVDSHTFGKYHPSAHGSYRSAAWLDDADVTAKLEEARMAIDFEEQDTLYKEAQDMITELSPSLYLGNLTEKVAHSNRITQYEPSMLLGYTLAFYHMRVAD